MIARGLRLGKSTGQQSTKQGQCGLWARPPGKRTQFHRRGHLPTSGTQRADLRTTGGGQLKAEQPSPLPNHRLTGVTWTGWLRGVSLPLPTRCLMDKNDVRWPAGLSSWSESNDRAGPPLPFPSRRHEQQHAQRAQWGVRLDHWGPPSPWI